MANTSLLGSELNNDRKFTKQNKYLTITVSAVRNHFKKMSRLACEIRIKKFYE